MIKNGFVGLLFFVMGNLALGQGYDVTVEITDVDCGCPDTYHFGVLGIAGEVEIFGGNTPISFPSFTFPGRPLDISLDIEAIDDIFP